MLQMVASPLEIDIVTDLKLPEAPTLSYTELARTSIRKDWLNSLTTNGPVNLDSKLVEFLTDETSLEIDSTDVVWALDLLDAKVALNFVLKSLPQTTLIDAARVNTVLLENTLMGVRGLLVEVQALKTAVRRMIRSGHFKAVQTELTAQLAGLDTILSVGSAVQLSDNGKIDDARKRRSSLHLAKALVKSTKLAGRDGIRTMWQAIVNMLKASRKV